MSSPSMLDGVRVLLIEDHEDSRELLGDALRAHGVVVKTARTGENAVDVVSDWRPDVVLSDLDLPGIDGATALAQIHARVMCPAIALSGHASSIDRSQSLAAGFAKHLVKPARIADILAAIDAVRVRAGSDGESELRVALATLNRQSPCRYTSILRFAEDGTLISVWTHDDQAPSADPFPVGLPVAASYCVLVQRDRAPFAVEDARTDARVADHPKRDSLACYVGVPIWASDGTLFGTLCSYDPEPQEVSPELRQMHERMAQRLTPILARVFEATS